MNCTWVTQVIVAIGDRLLDLKSLQSEAPELYDSIVKVLNRLS